MVELGATTITKFPALSVMNPHALAIKLACLNSFVLAVACATLFPSLPLSAALRLFYAADLIACVGALGTALAALKPIEDMYHELLAASEMVSTMGM